jgi:hypothetical protein
MNSVQFLLDINIEKENSNELFKFEPNPLTSIQKCVFFIMFMLFNLFIQNLTITFESLKYSYSNEMQSRVKQILH